jgi:hypothetical protein
MRHLKSCQTVSKAVVKCCLKDNYCKKNDPKRAFYKKIAKDYPMV